MNPKPNFPNLLDISQWKLTPYQILVLGFAGLVFLGAILLSLPNASATGESLGFIDALFTATSAVCVTGLAVVDTGTRFSIFGQLVIIFLIQAGGLGIMTMATLMALLMRKKIQLRERLIMQEALNQLTVAGIVRLTQYIIKATLLVEFIGGTILAIHWYEEFGLISIYLGYWHAISAFCSAGFDIFGEFRGYTQFVDDIIVNFVVTSLIIIGSIGFTVISDVFVNKSFSRFSLHTKIVLTATGALIASGTILILLLELNNPATIGELSWKGKLLGSYFQAVTRTAGLNTVDIGELTNATLLLLIILMFIGASPASTGGGVKTTTASVVVAAVWAHISGKQDVELFGRRISSSSVYKAFSLVFISVALIIFFTMMMSITEKAEFLDILFEVVSAFGTVGLSTGITPELTSLGKVWLIFAMFAGKVGPVTVALALALRRRKTGIQYPEGRVIIG